MRLLLDSHALLWFCEGSASLSSTARSAIGTANDGLLGPLRGGIFRP